MSESPRANAPAHQAESIKDTLISIIIAFALAFVFRGFVIEAFVIPTGSMAPTLMGAHMRFRGQQTGYSWPVEPWQGLPGGGQGEYAPIQAPKSGSFAPVSVHDPMSGEYIQRFDVPLRSGDRILVLKYLYSVVEPSRFDVVVFKNPTTPTENYIKRLIGLPGEEIAIVDGDVFVRTPGSAIDPPDTQTWFDPGWEIARKPRLQQEAVWQTIFDSQFTPLNAPAFSGPWASDDPTAWNMDGASYRYEGAADGSASPTQVYFDTSRPRFAPAARAGLERGENWTIDDRYAYDESPGGGREYQRRARFPVSDLRMRAGIQPDGTGLNVQASITARSREFQAVLSGASIVIRQRILTSAARPRDGTPPISLRGAWQELASAPMPATALGAGRITDVEFCHVDQSLQVWINGEMLLKHDYAMTPAERIEAVTGRTLEDILNDPRADRDRNPLGNPDLYQSRLPDVRWTFSGSRVTLHRVALDRDIYYQAGWKTMAAIPALGTSPLSPLRLAADQFFVCGDNSPASYDGRLWENVDPWVAYEIDQTVGVVPRDLLMGRAFFVYWPSLLKPSSRGFGRGLPVPDFGRMRFIW